MAATLMVHRRAARHLGRRCCRAASWFAAVGGLAASAVCAAAALADPTQPPPELSAAAAPSATTAAPTTVALRVSMIGRGPDARRFAQIGTRRVREGDAIDAADGPLRVVQITDAAVVLQRGELVQTLRLIPADIHWRRRPPSTSTP